MKIAFRILIIAVLSAQLRLTAVAHPGHNDPVLQELNDYLMMIQLMRVDDARAADIFKKWQELKAESWKIRTLTDEKNLLINANKVMNQISKTRTKQKQLLQECYDYFQTIIKTEKTIRFNVNQSIERIWESPTLNVQIQNYKILFVAIQNKRETTVQLRLTGNKSDEILFWNKQFSLAPNAMRYTFVLITPLSESLVSNVLSVSDGEGNVTSATISLKGIDTTGVSYTLRPGNSMYKVALPSESDISYKFDTTFNEAIRFSISDKESGNQLTARITVEDDNNDKFWFPIKGPSFAVNKNSGWRTTLWDYQPGPYFYINGKADLGVNPSGKTATIYHGFEYKPSIIKVPENGIVDVEMERWINMSDLGWYSGQTHIHTTDVGSPVQFSQYWPIISRAEDLNVSAILTLKGEWDTHAIYANEYPMGIREAFSTPDHKITYGEEFRNNPYGHLAFLGLDYLIQPISTGALGELGGPDYPSNAHILEEAMSQGATTIGAHFGNFIDGKDKIKTPWPSTGFEMPVDVALGKLHLAEIYGNGGQLSIWYDLLNCGFRIPATAGPDWDIKDTPRVYVHLSEQPFTLENWRIALQNGKSFITRGPMLFFSANKEEPGGVLDLSKGANEIQIEIEARTPAGNIPVEIVYNGNVIAKSIDKTIKITIDDSGWIAARCEGAHSNPVYINFKDRPAGNSEPAREFITIIDRLAKWVETKGLFYSEAEKKEVLDAIDQGRKVYENIIEFSEALGRK